MIDAVLVLTTFPADGDADSLARTLVSERLAACVSVCAPMRSTYRWKDAIEVADERQLVIKTTRGRVAELAVRLKQLHPYEVPEFLVLDVNDGDPNYLNWLSQST